MTLRGIAPGGGGSGTVTAVTASSPLSSSGGTTPDISLSGNITVSHLNSGTGASASTFWRGDGTWATPSGGAGITPGYVSGNYYNNLYRGYGAGGASSSVSIATGTIFYTPFFVEVAATFTTISTVPGTSSVNLNMCLYADSGSMKPTGAPIANTTSGSVSTTSGSLASYTFSPALTLSAGIYWIGFTASSTCSLPCPGAGGYEAGLNRYLGRPTTPDGTPIDTEQQAGWKESFVYSTTMPTVGGSLTAVTATASGDNFFWLRAQ